MRKNSYYTVLLGTMFSLMANAGSEGYVCKILEIQELDTSGKFVKHKGIFSQLIGESFSIERTTGKVVGNPFSNKSYQEIRVLSQGTSENGYQHVTISPPPNIWITYVYVAEYTQGLQKPFWGASDGNKIFSGLCR